MENIESVKKLAQRVKTVIDVVGSTGAGKSSAINAMLDEEHLVPTNCIRACTAVVTEISYNHKTPPYRAEVEFISPEDLRKEPKTFFNDLLDGSGEVSQDCTNEDSEAGIAYAKLRAVYPLLTKDEMARVSIDRLMNTIMLATWVLLGPSNRRIRRLFS